MIGIIIIAHGSLAQSLADGVRHVLGAELKQLAVLGIDSREDPDVFRLRAREMVHHVERGDGVLVLTDLYGSTPANIAKSLHYAGKVEVVSGVNLSMLVRAVWYRDHPLEEVTRKAMAGGLGGVIRTGWDV